MMGYGYGLGGPAGMGGLGGFGWLGSLLLVVLLVLGIVYLVRALDLGRGTGRTAQADDSALRVLRERYARGEIDRDEFELRRKDLA